MNGLDDKAKLTAPTLGRMAAYVLGYDANGNSEIYVSIKFAQSGSSSMRRFEREEDLIHPQVFNAATWGARMLLAIAICLLAVGVSLADGKKHKLSNDLEAFKDGSNGPTVDVIIQFNQVPTDVHHQKVQNKGGVLKTKLDAIMGAHYSVPVASLSSLAGDPDVAYISPNRPLSGTSTLDYGAETGQCTRREIGRASCRERV